MANMTLSIPEKLHVELAAHPEIRWSEVARQAFEKKILELHWMNKALGKSRMKEKDAERIGRGIKAEIGKRFSK